MFMVLYLNMFKVNLAFNCNDYETRSNNDRIIFQIAYININDKKKDMKYNLGSTILQPMMT
jgi:hypothetical protein